MQRFTKLNPRYDEASDMANASSQVKDASNLGQTAINSYDPTAAGNTSSNAVASNFNTAQGQNSQAVDPLAAAIKANPTVTSLYQQGNDLYNVPQLANTATQLTNRVNNAIPEGYGGARGFDISSDQINNGVANKLAYLTPQANAATANYNTASGLASKFVEAGQAQNAQNLIPAQTNAQLTAQNMAAESTGWNQAQKSTLDGLMAKMNQGVALSTAELETARQLAATEEAYNQAVVGANAQTQVANIQNTYATLAPNQTLYNTTNGQHYNPLGGMAKSMSGG